MINKYFEYNYIQVLNVTNFDIYNVTDDIVVNMLYNVHDSLRVVHFI